MDWAKLAAAVVAGLRAIWPALQNALIAIGAALVQKKIDQGNDAKDTLAAVKRADDAASQPVDVLRDLQSRGRMRDL